MFQSSSSYTANGRMNNGNIGNYKIPKRNSANNTNLENDGSSEAPTSISSQNNSDLTGASQCLIKTEPGVLIKTEPGVSPRGSSNFKTTPDLTKSPKGTPILPGSGFVRTDVPIPTSKADFFKYAEPKREPSATPDEPLKDLTPMQQELESFLPAGAKFATLPAKLSEKFSISTCQLCKVNMLSIVQSKMHYNGKPHMKKVRSFLTKECGKADEPLPKVSKIDFGRELKEEETRECKICKVIFNSSVHANQHYEGKKHKKALVNYERTGASAVDGRFGIGADFPTAKPVETIKAASLSSKLFCEICKVQASSTDQYKMHVEGARHKKNFKKVNGNSFDTAAANARKHIPEEPEITGFDLTENEYISKYEDY